MGAGRAAWTLDGLGRGGGRYIRREPPSSSDKRHALLTLTNAQDITFPSLNMEVSEIFIW